VHHVRALLCLFVLLTACRSEDGGLSYYTVKPLGLLVPEVAGWQRDKDVEQGGVDRLMGETDKGGVVFRLQRDNAVAGSPRINVVVDPKSPRATHLEEFLTRNLREMADMEQRGEIRISNIDQRPVQVGPRRAYRVRHEYVLAGANAAITQVTTLLVVDGRGVAVSAVGRTELFAPLASEIETILGKLKTQVPDEPRREEPPPPPPEKPKEVLTIEKPPAMIQPIDLGKVGGEKR
jgi:hypothetical protein